MKRKSLAALHKRKARKARRQRARLYKVELKITKPMREALSSWFLRMEGRCRPVPAEKFDPYAIAKSANPSALMRRPTLPLLRMRLDPYIPDGLVSGIFLSFRPSFRFGRAVDCFELGIETTYTGGFDITRYTTFHDLRNAYRANVLAQLEDARARRVEFPPELEAVIDSYSKAKAGRRASELARYYRKVTRYFDTSLPKDIW